MKTEFHVLRAMAISRSALQQRALSLSHVLIVHMLKVLLFPDHPAALAWCKEIRAFTTRCTADTGKFKWANRQFWQDYLFVRYSDLTLVVLLQDDLEDFLTPTRPEALFYGQLGLKAERALAEFRNYGLDAVVSSPDQPFASRQDILDRAKALNIKFNLKA